MAHLFVGVFAHQLALARVHKLAELHHALGRLLRRAGAAAKAAAPAAPRAATKTTAAATTATTTTRAPAKRHNTQRARALAVGKQKFM